MTEGDKKKETTSHDVNTWGGKKGFCVGGFEKKGVNQIGRGE